jgi:hypothetical protein
LRLLRHRSELTPSFPTRANLSVNVELIRLYWANALLEAP